MQKAASNAEKKTLH